MKQNFLSTLAITLLFTNIIAHSTHAYSLLDDPLGTTNNLQNFKDCYGEEIDKNKPLYLSDIVEIAICNNPTIRQDYLSAKIAGANYGEALAAYFPTLKGNGTISRSAIGKTSDTMDYDSQMGAGLTMSWLLFDFGARSASTERSKQNLIAANFTFDNKLQKSIFDITEAYYQMLGYAEATKSAEASEESAKSAYDAASKRYELGLVALSDKLQAETSYAEAQLYSTKAKNSLEISRGALLSLLNLAPNTRLNIASFSADVKELAFKNSIDELIKIALEKRTDIIAEKATVKAEEANLKYAERKNLPSLSFSSGLKTNDTIHDHDRATKSGNIGLELSVPLFTGFADTYNITRNRYALKSAQAKYDAVQRAVEKDVWDTYQNYTTAIKDYEISTKLLNSALENERVALGAYKAGKGDIISLLNAQSKLSDARVSKVSAIYSVFVAKNNLLRALNENLE